MCLAPVTVVMITPLYHDRGCASNNSNWWAKLLNCRLSKGCICIYALGCSTQATLISLYERTCFADPKREHTHCSYNSAHSIDIGDFQSLPFLDLLSGRLYLLLANQAGMILYVYWTSTAQTVDWIWRLNLYHEWTRALYEKSQEICNCGASNWCRVEANGQSQRLHHLLAIWARDHPTLTVWSSSLTLGNILSYACFIADMPYKAIVVPSTHAKEGIICIQ